MKQNKNASSSTRRPTAKPARKAQPAFKLTPAEREVEAIRKRRRDLWRELGSLEAVEEFGRKVREERAAAKKTTARKRSA